MTAKSICTHRVSIVTGHYGTGKTEFSVNLALALAKEGANVMIADLDIVNPYFRSRERKQILEEAGVQLISSSQSCSNADLPALPAELLSILENRQLTGVLDIGGDPVGARVLARFQPKIIQEDYQLIYVLNATRPEVRTVDSAITYLRNIEAITGLTCTGIVNNTHLCGERPKRKSETAQRLPPQFPKRLRFPFCAMWQWSIWLINYPTCQNPFFPLQ